MSRLCKTAQRSFDALARKASASRLARRLAWRLPETHALGRFYRRLRPRLIACSGGSSSRPRHADGPVRVSPLFNVLRGLVPSRAPRSSSSPRTCEVCHQRGHLGDTPDFLKRQRTATCCTRRDARLRAARLPCTACTGLDSDAPRCRSQIVPITMLASDRNSLCQF